MGVDTRSDDETMDTDTFAVTYSGRSEDPCDEISLRPVRDYDLKLKTHLSLILTEEKGPKKM